MIELPVSAKFCFACGGPVERKWSGTLNITTKPRVHKIEELVAQGMSGKAAISEDYRKQVEALKHGPQLGHAASVQTGKIPIASAIAAGRESRQAGYMGFNTRNSTMPVPRGQAATPNPGGITLPRLRPSIELMDAETRKARGR